MDTEGPCLDPSNQSLLGSWDRVDGAMDRLFDPAFRHAVPDSAGRPFVVGWFFLSWTGFTSNPRARAFGDHAVRDHYLARWGDRLTECGDEQGWHYHHPPTSGVGNEWNADWSTGDEYARILSTQLAERDWFPSCYRAGGTIMTNESSQWVDRWFPMDYTNRAPVDVRGLIDWQRGVGEWRLYHPNPDDFMRPGSGRRRMARCLDLRTTEHVFDETELAAAFERARRGSDAIVSAFDHDYRDIADRVLDWRRLIATTATRYPDVPWLHAGPVEAIRRVVAAPARPPLRVHAIEAGTAVELWSTRPIHQSTPWLVARDANGGLRSVDHLALRRDETHWVWEPSPDADWHELIAGCSDDLGYSATTTIPRGAPVSRSVFDMSARADQECPNSVWEHSTIFLNSCVERVSGRAPETDAVHQTVALLSGRVMPGMSLLDVGCAAGHAWRSLRALGVEYHGIDPYQTAIELGRSILSGDGLGRQRLRAIAIERLPPDERYDAVVCLNTFGFVQDFREPLGIMSRAARRWMLIRSGFAESAEIRYLPDILLEPGFETMRAYFNVWARGDVEAFLAGEGFACTWMADQRQSEKFDGAPEVVGGIPLPYEWLLAERRTDPDTPTRLGDHFAAALARWRSARQGGPNS